LRASAGLVSVAVLLSDATIRGTTRAYVGGLTTIAANRSTSAHRHQPRDADHHVTGIGGIRLRGHLDDDDLRHAGVHRQRRGRHRRHAPVFLTARTPTNLADGTVVSVNAGGITISVVENTVNAGGRPAPTSATGSCRRLADRAGGLVEHVQRGRHARRCRRHQRLA
jgi:hypothetical protein